MYTEMEVSKSVRAAFTAPISLSRRSIYKSPSLFSGWLISEDAGYEIHYVPDTHADVGSLHCDGRHLVLKEVRILPWCKDEAILHTICKLICTF